MDSGPGVGEPSEGHPSLCGCRRGASALIQAGGMVPGHGPRLEGVEKTREVNREDGVYMTGWGGSQREAGEKRKTCRYRVELVR